MNANTKLALAIGGSVAVILVGWVSLSDHFGSKKAGDVSLVTSSTQPSDSLTSTTTAPPATDSLPAIVKTDTAAPATQPALTGNVNTANDWTRLLQNGSDAQSSGDVAAAPSTQPAMLAAFTTTNTVVPAMSPTTQPTIALGDSVPAAGSTHKVEPGETFYTIAAAVYGDASLYTKIEDANPNVKPNRLRVGTVLNIPDVKAAIASHGATMLAAVDSSPTPAPAAKESTSSTPKADIDPRTSYRVQASDTLMSISRKLYGNGQSWQKIYDANRDLIGTNPARLKIDWVLRLPEPPTLTITN